MLGGVLGLKFPYQVAAGRRLNTAERCSRDKASQYQPERDVI